MAAWVWPSPTPTPRGAVVTAGFRGCFCTGAEVGAGLRGRWLSEEAEPCSSAEVTMVPRSTVHLEGKEAQQVIRLMDALEDHDDVQNVYSNFDIPDSVLQAVEA